MNDSYLRDYSDYIAEQLDKTIEFSEYMTQQIDSSMSFADYINEQLNIPAQKKSDERKRKIDKFLDEN